MRYEADLGSLCLLDFLSFKDCRVTNCLLTILQKNMGAFIGGNTHLKAYNA